MAPQHHNFPHVFLPHFGSGRPALPHPQVGILVRHFAVPLCRMLPQYGVACNHKIACLPSGFVLRQKEQLTLAGVRDEAPTLGTSTGSLAPRARGGQRASKSSPHEIPKTLRACPARQRPTLAARSAALSFVQCCVGERLSCRSQCMSGRLPSKVPSLRNFARVPQNCVGVKLARSFKWLGRPTPPSKWEGSPKPAIARPNDGSRGSTKPRSASLQRPSTS